MLELKNISYSVDDENGRVDILKDVSVSFDGRFIAITGPNGSGKSTLAKIVAGIIKPTSGKILLDGEDITELGIDERARLGISYAFQQPVKFKGITVRDIISMASGKKLPLSAVCEYLSQMGLCAID
ncbi:MAG: ATP-binding cassette domain-containing protein, partial [Oscillospiraceae bacterium]|nr:ATP-binding cassette domain-containing protein [Oscillospiraceae bacterium]